MTELDDHINSQSVDDFWRTAYEHNLAHYKAGDKTDFHCPGGDKCYLTWTGEDATETE